MSMKWIDAIPAELGIEPYRIPIVILSAIGIYAAFMLLVAIFGSRVLANVSASDAVVITMFGAVGGRVILGNPTTMSTGILALACLMVLEAFFGTARRHSGLRHFVERAPKVVIAHGEYVDKNIRAAHLSRTDLAIAMRRAGIGAVEDVAVMIIETNGTLTTLREGQRIDPTIFDDAIGVELLDR